MSTHAPAKPSANDWTTPQAMAIPKEGYFEEVPGRVAVMPVGRCSARRWDLGEDLRPAGIKEFKHFE